MRIAAIYDVHANLPALEAVLDEIESSGADRVVVGGDVVPGPMPAETLSALLACGVPTSFLKGNGERDVLTARGGGEPARVPEAFRDTVRWVAEALSAEHVTTLEGWPATLRHTLPGLGEILFCHATPRDDNELFTRLTSEDRLRPIFASTGADVVVCGHTHMQFDRTVGGVRVVNAGSVGMPFGERGAHWLLLGPGGVQLRRTPYDVASAVEHIQATGYPRPSDFDLLDPPSEAEMLELFEAAALQR